MTDIEFTCTICQRRMTPELLAGYKRDWDSEEYARVPFCLLCYQDRMDEMAEQSAEAQSEWAARFGGHND